MAPLDCSFVEMKSLGDLQKGLVLSRLNTSARLTSSICRMASSLLPCGLGQNIGR